MRNFYEIVIEDDIYLEALNDEWQLIEELDAKSSKISFGK